MKTPAVSIGIPTYEAGISLIRTLNSIFNQSAFSQIREVIIVVDGNTLTPQVRNRLRHPKVRIVMRPERMGQSSCLNYIFSRVHNGLLLLTNDDVVLDKHATKNFIECYIAQRPDFLAAQAKPLPPKSLFERILFAGQTINTRIASRWLNGDNYLSVNGRMIALSRRLYSNISIPPGLWNNDAYIYLYAKLKNLGFINVNNARVYYKLPGNVADHLRQSYKFHLSQRENEIYFHDSLTRFYKIPVSLSIKAMIHTLFDQPVFTPLYIVFSALTRIWLTISHQSLPNTGYWNTDRSTKLLGGKL
ncbi:MAG: hypothetical protein UV73_C0003G0053 [Candidatus Gottesmanbacteria bacterium GW2011_GWA2_43_14]|uniref:Glycosyltransferase 2-like domain-containing protein n=1 Tax=Candidatus Gottesmanbacteria bacterium GW2011_GWA2_43_14 TaxID=1618443 RepID=A0A0G1FSY6_9BACT|nr:MAG: hypothetical protein UV73_C0003G0053 [Candidatus Gottesmanbacteria bacterium GW2011_GWA2_43_14]